MQVDLGRAETLRQLEQRLSSRWLIRQTTVEIVSLTPARTRWPAAATTRSKLPGRLRKRSCTSGRWLSSESPTLTKPASRKPAAAASSSSQPLEFSESERPNAVSSFDTASRSRRSSGSPPPKFAKSTPARASRRPASSTWSVGSSSAFSKRE